MDRLTHFNHSSNQHTDILTKHGLNKNLQNFGISEYRLTEGFAAEIDNLQSKQPHSYNQQGQLERLATETETLEGHNIKRLVTFQMNHTSQSDLHYHYLHQP